MIRHKSKGLLIVVSGPSGAGKDTICNKLIEEMKDTKISVSMTSREPRGKEVDGVDYFFISKEEFEERIKNDEFLEYAIVHNNQYYGTPKTKIEDELNNGKNIIYLGTFSKYISPSINVGYIITNAYINEFKNYNYVVVNDKVEKAVDKVKSIITAEKCRVDRIEDIYLNTKEEFIHEGLIDKEFENREIEI